MDMRAAKRAVFDHWLARWGSRTPVIVEKEPAVLPAAPFVRVSMRENASEQATIGGPGNKVFERTASVYVQIFAPAVDGAGPMTDLEQAARDVFEATTLNVAGESLWFGQVDVDPGADEPHLVSSIVEAQCRYQQRK